MKEFSKLRGQIKKNRIVEVTSNIVRRANQKSGWPVFPNFKNEHCNVEVIAAVFCCTKD